MSCNVERHCVTQIRIPPLSVNPPFERCPVEPSYETREVEIVGQHRLDVSENPCDRDPPTRNFNNFN